MQGDNLGINKNPITADHKVWPRVGIIVLNWNGWQHTLACLNTIFQLDYPEYFTIIVDNGSGDDSVERIRRWAEKRSESGFVMAEYLQHELSHVITSDDDSILDALPSNRRMVFIRTAENLGFAEGNNIAIRYALGRRNCADYIFLLNNDTWVENACIARLMDVVRKTGAHIVGALIKDYDSDDIQAKVDLENRYTFVAEIFSPLANSFLSRPNYEKDHYQCSWLGANGLLVSSTFLNYVFSLTQRYIETAFFMYCEDTELCFFARQLGYKCVVSRDAIIHHRLAGSSGGMYNPIAYYYSNRNLTYLADRYLPRILKPVFLIYMPLNALIRIIKNILIGRYCSAKAIFCGVLDAYKGITGKWKYHDEYLRRRTGLKQDN